MTSVMRMKYCPEGERTGNKNIFFQQCERNKKLLEYKKQTFISSASSLKYNREESICNVK